MTSILLLAFLFLVAGVIAVPLATRAGLGSVLGYLIAGIAISPALGVLQVDVVQIQHFAEFGVVMMLFLVGLELEPEKLWDMRGRLLGLGGGQVVLTMLAVMGAGVLFGLPWTVALAAGSVLALSSTAIVLQTLTEKGLLKSDGGQASFAVLLTQDIAVIPMLALLPLLAMPGAGHGPEAAHDAGMSLVADLNGWQTMLVTLAAIAAVVIAGRTLTGPVFRFIAKADLRELFVAAALMMVVGIALLMSLVGLSPALGTFIAGVVLAGSDYRHELESDIDPFRGLLLGLFFMSVGAGIDFALLFDQFALILGLTVGLMASKAAILLLLAYLFRLELTDRWLFGLGLAQAGEFGFVLLSFVVAGNIMPAALADQLLLVVALSMLLTPALFIFHDRVILPRAAKGVARAQDRIEAPAEVIIAGHGRVGGIVKRILEGGGYAPTVIDYSAAQIDTLRMFGLRAYFGDATRPDMLEAAGIRTARMLVVAIDDREKATELVAYVKEHFPHVHVIARARDRHHVYELFQAGCRDIVRETFDSSVRIGRSALEALGIDHETAVAMAEGFVADDSARLIVMAPVFAEVGGNPMDPRYLEKTKELMALQDQIYAEVGPSFGLMRARMAAAGDDVDEIARRNGVALSPDDPVPGR
ncbi:Kef-type potassium/proton antiporter, CPA2 family [Loktanella atrilutea]|uniref:Kef-type potassium/proton antiporter, CPA2 family n=1 Tax=Loktanella atrilutea TaxID=366533 RepID=A0A1M5CTK0_LOKAT|nr:cation:proton antiporter [Loktanella atrilutea]SHF58065.1 Kef-type potassium/proton antiporter, CPA2 family [Loktanella atrilutea]